MDETALAALKASLAADGYQLAITHIGDLISASVSPGPDACAECLVPKTVFRGILAHALGISEAMIEVAYPGEGTSFSNARA
jgi:hypothetical protein